VAEETETRLFRKKQVMTCIDSTWNSGDIINLRELILTHAVSGEVAKRTVGYLFSVIDTQERVSAQDITDNGGPNGDSNVCPFMSRLRDQLSDFFDYHPVGRKERYRAIMPSDDRGNYAIRIGINAPPNGLVPGFWSPYISGGNVLLVYPEMMLAEDPTSIYLPNDKPTNRSGPIRLLLEDSNVDSPSGKPVVSGILVRSIFRLSECLHTWKVGVRETPVRPSVDMVDAGDMIVLGTPASMPLLLPNLEAAARMKTGAETVTITADTKDGRKRQKYQDIPESYINGNGSGTEKWGVLTRHRYRFQRTLTVLAAKDEAAVDVKAQFLIDEEAMLMLAKALRCGPAFPDHFQALFLMHIFKGHPYARKMTVVEAIDLGVNGKCPLLAVK
jgi:hypothetical protein